MDLNEETSQDENAISICAFAADVMSRMGEPSSFSSWMREEEVCETLAKTMAMFPLSHTTELLSARSLRLLDTSATALWNVFIRFLQRGHNTLEVEIEVVQVPLLACRMLESCHLQDGNVASGIWKLLQVLVKCAEICLGANMIEEAADVLQRATMKIESVDLVAGSDPDAQNYVAKYYLLCAWVALKIERLEEANLNISRFPQEVIKTSPALGEQFARICIYAFRLTVTGGFKELIEPLMQKLSQTFSILRQYRHDAVDYQKLNSELFHALVTVNLKGISETVDRLASELLQIVEQDQEGHIDHIAWLEMMIRQDEPDIEAFYQTLVDYINAMEPTASNFRRCLQYIFKFRFQDPEKAMMVLRLLYEDINTFPHNEHWLQQNFVALIRLVSSPPWIHSECIGFLTDIANVLNTILPEPLSSAPSNASLIILWKYIESSALKNDYLEAQEWCRFGQHALFQRASPANRASILRKLIYFAYQIGDSREVKCAWELLAKQERDPATMHIMYQLALKDSDAVLAASILASIIELENGEHRYALAAVAAAAGSQLSQEALQSVYILIDKSPIVLKKKPINLDLHRALVRLIVSELREPVDDTDKLKAQILTRAVQQDTSDLNDHDWFVRSAYMLLLEASRGWAASHLLLLLDTCLELIDRYPKDVGSHVKSEMDHRRLSCNLLGILIYTNMARAETDCLKKKSFYARVISHYDDIETVIKSSKNGKSHVVGFTGNIISESFLTTKQLRQTQCFNLEAVIYLEKWADVEDCIRESIAMNDADDAHSIMANIILTSDKMPYDYVIRSLHVLFTFIQRTNNTTKLPGFIRCLFGLSIHHRDNPHLCESVLDQAHAVARDMSTDGHNEAAFPDEELEYLSTTAFNYAVDLYLSRNQDEAQRWAQKAIGLARLMKGDCGRLAVVLEAKYGKWLTYSD